DPVEVGAEAEESHVAEVEQSCEADDDVQPEGQQGVDQRQQPVAVEVPTVGDEREDRERPEQDDQSRERRRALPPPGDRAANALLSGAPLVDACDPLIGPDTALDRTQPIRRRGGQVLAPFSAAPAHLTPQPSPSPPSPPSPGGRPS